MHSTSDLLAAAIAKVEEMGYDGKHALHELPSLIEKLEEIRDKANSYEGARLLAMAALSCINRRLRSMRHVKKQTGKISIFNPPK